MHKIISRNSLFTIQQYINMENKEGENTSKSNETDNSSKETNSTKNKAKGRGKKRKRRNSDSSSEFEEVLPDNALELERSVHASAVKNNLDDISVRKILKKVVSNDHVLALVKLREEEEDSGPEENSLRPKLTRAKVKELMRVSPKAGAWNLENLELTPIKHIPVKTRPEVKALIAQELPEDEDDDEYEPTHDDVPSDDDQGLESCSDLDSQPRTPATPRSQASPRVVKDGPFKVPQDIITPTSRKLDLEEEATIALRTRSKLSLSATSIEHIESTFVPPDEVPMPVDDLWNEFLNECLNPASTSKHEDDDETDPEYNAAADADAHDEDEEALSNSIIKISKKELNDLVTELFNIMPEASGDDEMMADKLANSVLTDTSQTEVTRWEGKQEPVSDDENGNQRKLSDRLTFEKKSYSRVSIGKTEPQDVDETEALKDKPIAIRAKGTAKAKSKKSPVVRIAMQEEEDDSPMPKAPPLLQQHLDRRMPQTAGYVEIQVKMGTCVLPEQIQILQQQLRQHIQLATSNYLQLYVHPIHWSFAPHYKEYLETLLKLGEKNPKSVVNVCNLKPAIELIETWEKTVSTNTPENAGMVEFIQKEADRCFRRGVAKNLYVGEFHEVFKKVVANSPVFLYPYLLPSMPYRRDQPRRFSYLSSEDHLIALGLDQFWQYIAANPSIFKRPKTLHPRQRWGLSLSIQLVVKHMFPWMSARVLHSHIQNVRKEKNADKENPIYKYFKTGEVSPVQHQLLPYNDKLTLYEQPEHEVPKIWVRYLAKTSKRFRNYMYKRHDKTGKAPMGVEVKIGQAIDEPIKTPLPINFTRQIVSHNIDQPPSKPPLADKFDIQITDKSTTTPYVVSNLYQYVETSTGAYLLPLTVTVDTNNRPITTPSEVNSKLAVDNPPETAKDEQTNRKKSTEDHCTCCVLLRKILKQKQTTITDYFGTKKSNKCGCEDKRYPKVSNRLKLFVNNYKSSYTCMLQELQSKMKVDKNKPSEDDVRLTDTGSVVDDLANVTTFHLKLLTRLSVAKDVYLKRKVNNIFFKFNPYEHDPLELAAQVDQAFGTELLDLYKEFLGFLTPEQADKLNAFRDYFITNCVADLIRKIEEQVPDNDKKRTILKELNQVFGNILATSCEMCTSIMATMKGYPRLAEHVFSLFPHRKDQGSEPKEVPSAPATTQSTETVQDDTTMCDESAVIEETAVDYEADRSMSEEDETSNSCSRINSDTDNDETGRLIKTENISVQYPTTSERISLVVTVSKTEMQDFNESSNSMKLMFEDEIVKSECPEWKRDEDKLILEVLKEHLTPEERQDKTIIEIVEEKNIIDTIAEILSHKSKNDVKMRLLYLLQLC